MASGGKLQARGEARARGHRTRAKMGDWPRGTARAKDRGKVAKKEEHLARGKVKMLENPRGVEGRAKSRG